MATHALGAARPPRGRRLITLPAAIGLILGLCLVPATAAAAEPVDTASDVTNSDTTVSDTTVSDTTVSDTTVSDTTKTIVPTTADEAKQAWIDAARRSEQWGEKVLDTQTRVATTKAQATTAAGRLRKADLVVDAAQTKVDAAQKKVAAADALVARYQARVDAFANASFRGARLSEMSLLLTADSADDYLDTATSLDRVAAETQATLAGIKTARETAEAARAATQQARAEADEARAHVADVKNTADQAAAAAVKARKDLDAGHRTLDRQITAYQLAYARLSSGDRSDAVADMEAANMSSAAQARVSDQAAQRQAAGIAPDDSVDYTTPEGAAQAAKEAPSVAAGIAVEAALSRQGMPYVWAATGPDTFDCSGLMLWAWQQAGITIPRTSAEQSTLQSVPLDELRPGDLVTFYSPVSHVGMYVGHGKVLHASMPGVPIKVVDLDAAGPDPSGHRVNS